MPIKTIHPDIQLTKKAINSIVFNVRKSILATEQKIILENVIKDKAKESLNVYDKSLKELEQFAKDKFEEKRLEQMHINDEEKVKRLKRELEEVQLRMNKRKRIKENEEKSGLAVTRRIEKRGRKTNSEPTIYHCGVCDYSCKKSYNLKRHVLSKHTDKSQWPQCCETCNLRFVSVQDLNRHKKTKKHINKVN